MFLKIILFVLVLHELPLIHGRTLSKTLTPGQNKPEELSDDLRDRLIHVLDEIKPLLAKEDVNDDPTVNKEADNTKVKTYGMNLNFGEGNVWNDIIHDNGTNDQISDSPTLPANTQEHLEFYHDEEYSDEDDIRREIIKRIQEIFLNHDKRNNDQSVVGTDTMSVRDGTEKSDVMLDETNGEIESIEMDGGDGIKSRSYEKTYTNEDRNIAAEEVTETLSTDKFMEQLQQGRTYGMNLTNDEGVVWNNLHGVHINYGEENAEYGTIQPGLVSPSLSPIDEGDTVNENKDNEDIFFHIDQKQTSEEPEIFENSKDDVDESGRDYENKDEQSNKESHQENSSDENLDSGRVQIYNTPQVVVEDLNNEKEVDSNNSELENNNDLYREKEHEELRDLMIKWTISYTDLIFKFIDRKISEALTDFRTTPQLDTHTDKIFIPEETPKAIKETYELSDKKPMFLNDSEIPESALLKRRKDRDENHKKPHENKIPEQENPLETSKNEDGATTKIIYGNAVGNKEVKNIFVFLSGNNASNLNFLQNVNHVVEDGDYKPLTENNDTGLVGDKLSEELENKDKNNSNKEDTFTPFTEQNPEKDENNGMNGSEASEKIPENTDNISTDANEELETSGPEEEKETTPMEESSSSKEVASESGLFKLRTDYNDEFDSDKIEVPKQNQENIDNINSNEKQGDIDLNEKTEEETKSNEEDFNKEITTESELINLNTDFNENFNSDIMETTQRPENIDIINSDENQEELDSGLESKE